MDYSPPDSSVHRIFQAIILEWVAISFSRGSWPRNQTHVSCVSWAGRQTLYHRATWEALTDWAVLGHSVVSDSLWPHGLQPARLLCPWDSPGKNTGVGSHAHFQVFPTQGLNPGLPHYRWILYQLRHQGSPRILEWEADPFSRGTSRPKDWPRVSCLAGGFLTNWASREASITDYLTFICSRKPNISCDLLYWDRHFNTVIRNQYCNIFWLYT